MPEQSVPNIPKSRFRKAFRITLIYLIFSLIVPLGLWIYSYTVPFKYVDEPWWIEGTLQSNFMWLAILAFMILAIIGQILFDSLIFWANIRTKLSKVLIIYSLFLIIFSALYITMGKYIFSGLGDIYSFNYIFGEKLREFFLLLYFAINPILFIIRSIWQLRFLFKKSNLD